MMCGNLIANFRPSGRKSLRHRRGLYLVATDSPGFESSRSARAGGLKRAWGYETLRWSRSVCWGLRSNCGDFVWQG